MRKTNEPFFWSLFGGGGVLGAMFGPVLIFAVVFGVGFGLAGEDTFAYERVSSFAHSLLGGLFLTAIVGLTLWQCCHRIFHALHDFGFHAGLGIKAGIYGVATIGILLCLVNTVFY